MEGSWIITLGTLSLYLFFILIGASLLGLALQRALGGAAARHRGKLPRVLLEYVGNTSLMDDDVDGEERRRNQQARVLVDYIKQQMDGQQVPQTEAERILERLRESMRAEGQGQEYSG